MALQVVNQDTVLEHALELVRSARRSIWITSPWITQRAAGLLLDEVLPRVRSSDLEVRVVYRVKEATDLEITDFSALKALERAGCQIAFSTRLHAKLVLCDGEAAIVTSSNLTSTAGYAADFPANRRNEELGVLVRDEPRVLGELEEQFLAIWGTAFSVEADTVGIAMDFPTVHGFSFAAIREVREGSYATARGASGATVIGRVCGITAYNRTFPQMSHSMWLTQGYAGTAGRRGRVEVPDLATIFSHPAKERGLLVTRTFLEPESTFHVAQVEVLKHVGEDRLTAPAVPAAPGSEVRRASTELLARLLGEGDIGIGSVLHHPEAAVALKGEEILSKHLAVLGMTGSGKSNALKVFIKEFLGHRGFGDVRVVIIDTHGEYAKIAQALAAHRVILKVADEDGTLAIRDEAGGEQDLAGPGLYILDLRDTSDLEGRAEKAALLMRYVFERSKETDGERRALVVIDEAQNYVPEQQTGWLKRVRPAFDAVFNIATEGRKFGVGLVVSTQRPARVNKDVLSQCNTHIIFRVANVDDLAAITGSFEAASQPLLAELPGFDTGVCVIGGTAIGMVTRVEVPLFRVERVE